MASPKPPVLRLQLLAEQATHCFLLSYQYWMLPHRRLKVGPGLRDEVYATDLNGDPIAPDLCEKLTEGILSVLSGSFPLEVLDMRRDGLIEYFTRAKLADKVGVLKSWKEEIPCLRHRDLVDFTIEPVSLDLDRLRIFEIRPDPAGIVQRYPTGFGPWALGEYRDRAGAARYVPQIRGMGEASELRHRC
jgi:hypothetical protein